MRGDLSLALDANARQQDDVMRSMAASADRLAALDALLLKLQADIDYTRHRVDVERSEVAALARSIYTEPSSALVLIAQSSSLDDAMTRTSDLVAARRRGHAIEDRLTSDLATLRANQAKQQTLREQEAQVQRLLTSSLERISQLQDQGLAISLVLNRAIRDIQDELSGISYQAPDLVATIRLSLLAEEEAAVTAARQQLGQLRQVLDRIPTPSQLNRSALQANARFTWPLRQPLITQGYGPSPYYFEPAVGPYPHFHTGVDFAAPIGTPVMATAAGEVAEVSSDSVGYGNYIVIRHDGHVSTLYGHLSLAILRVGDTVTQGQSIGLVGSTGNSTGPHVHFEVRDDNIPVDPTPFLPFGDGS